MSSTAVDETEPYAEIANKLAVRLVLVLLCGAAVNVPLALLALEFSPIGLVGLAVANVLVLWIALRAVFAALDDLLEAKLAENAENVEGRSGGDGRDGGGRRLGRGRPQFRSARSNRQ